jgi:hypothetical protein
MQVVYRHYTQIFFKLVSNHDFELKEIIQLRYLVQ